MADIIKPSVAHELVMKDRKSLRLTGVSEVLSFDDLSVTLKTVCGELTVDGEGLRISSLDTVNGILIIDGNVSSLSYFDKKREGTKGVFGRIFG